MNLNEILAFFEDIFILGFTFSLNSLFVYLGLFFSYILAFNKDWKQSFKLIFWLFLGRMLIILFFSGLAVVFDAQTFIIYFYENLFIKSSIFLLFSIFIILGILFSYQKNIKLLEKFEYLIFFSIGLLFGIVPNIISKVFYSNLNLNISNKFLGIFCGFIFNFASFFSVLFVFVFIISFFTNKIFSAFPKLQNYALNISGFILIYMGFYQILKILLK